MLRFCRKGCIPVQLSLRAQEVIRSQTFFRAGRTFACHICPGSLRHWRHFACFRMAVFMQDVRCQVYGIVVLVLAYIDHVCKLCRSAVEKDQAVALKTDSALHDRGHCDRAVAI